MIAALLMLAGLQQAEPTPAPAVAKFQIVDPGEMNQRCASEALVKCLKMDKPACEAAANESAAAANAEIDQATGGKTLTAFDAGFYQGQAIATFMAEMQKRTSNRFVKCVRGG